MYTIEGMQDFNFETKDGDVIDGMKIHFSFDFPDSPTNFGRGVDSIFCKRDLVPAGLCIGSHYFPACDRKGKLVRWMPEGEQLSFVDGGK